MTITASGGYGLTFEKFLNATSLPASGLESETAVSMLMVTDSYTPDFNAHDFYNDITNEVTGTGYSAGGATLTSTELTVGSGNLTWDAVDVSWPSSTIANAMAGVAKFSRGGASSADELVLLLDFVTAASSSNGTFAINFHSSGLLVVDLTP